MTQVSVIIASRDEGSRLISTVSDLLAGLGPADELIVVDDGSGDGSAIGLDHRLDRRLTVIRSETPCGVARARNLGARRSTGDVLVFSDAHVSVSPGWVGRLVAALAPHRTGAVGPVISVQGRPDVQGWGLRFRDDATNLEWLLPGGYDPYPVPVLAGAFIGVRRQVFEELKGFDPGMRSYGMEDIEFSVHVWLRGYSCVLIPAVTVAHYYRDEGDTPQYQHDWQGGLTNVLRLGVVHFGPDRLARLSDCYRADPSFAASLAAAVAGDAPARRRWVQAMRRRDDDWYFAVCNQVAP